MSSFNKFQLPPLDNWQDFESLCCDIWSNIWKDSNTQKNGRSQSQDGVDISGRPNKGKLWSGIQCKLKHIEAKTKLSESEVKDEIEKAKKFKPPLSELIIATTGPKDAKIEKFAREITLEHSEEHLFSVHIWSWDDIKNHLSSEIIDKYYSEFIISRENIKELISVIHNSRVLFVGDELSKKSGVKSFRFFILETIKSITNHEFDEAEYDELTEKLHLESAFKILYDELGENILVYFEEFIHYKPNDVHYYIANEIKNGKWVFTTNRDNLIEEACKNERIPLESKLFHDDFDFSQLNNRLDNNLNSTVGRLLKLNGTIDESEKEIKFRFKSILANLNRIGGISPDQKIILENALKKFDFCVMGFDCSDNFKFFPILKNTDTDRFICCLNTNNSVGKNIKIIRKKQDLEYEIGKEISDTPIDTKVLCVNNILLKKKKFLKMTGDWSEIIQKELCSSLKMNYDDNFGSSKSVDYSKEKKELSEKVDDFKRNIIFGLIWEKCLSKAKSTEFFNKAILFSEKGNKAQPIQDMDKARAIHNLARVYDVQYGKLEKDNVFDKYQKSFDIYIDIGIKYNFIHYKYKAIQCKLGLANYKRRALNQFDAALHDCEEIKRMLDEVDKEAKEMIEIQINDDERCLTYAQYYSCLGLIYSRYGTAYMHECIYSLNRSLKYRKKAGDIKGEADSENAIGLIKVINHNRDVKVLKEAISHLHSSLNINESIGNLIGAAQNYRNLGLGYKNLISCNETKDDNDIFFYLAKESYESGIRFWLSMKEGPRVEDLTECKFRLGELEIKYGKKYGGDMIKGIEILQEVDNEYEKRGDWNKRIRTLNILSQAYADEDNLDIFTITEAKQTIDKIISIYNSAINDPMNLKEQIKNDSKILENVVEITGNIEKIIDYIEKKNTAFGEFGERRTSIERIVENMAEIQRELD